MFEILLKKIKWQLTAGISFTTTFLALEVILISKYENKALVIALASLPFTALGVLYIIFCLLNAFKDLNHWYVQILDFIYLPMSITDLDMNWTFINEPVNDIINFTRKEALGKHCSNWGADICNTDQCGICMLRNKHGSSFFTNKGVDKNFQVDTTYLYDRKGNKIGHFELVSDITAKLRLEEAVRQLQEHTGEESIKIKHIPRIDKEGVDNSEMRQYSMLDDSISAEELFNLTLKANAANKAKSDFLANMSHEIRTPMNAILGFTEILQGKVTNPKQARYLKSIHTSGQALLTLINDILDLSKVEAGKMELEIRPVSLQHLFEDVKVIFAQKIGEKGLDLILFNEDDIPHSLLLDEVRLRQVLINLVGNAIKFTDSGYIKLALNHTVPDDNATGNTVDIIITIEDSGIGIPQDQCETIFDAFTQVKDQQTTKYGGTGLGLSISRRLIEMMGGTITASSEVDKGSSFVIKLNNVELVATETTQSTDESLIDVGTVEFKHSTILITDDVEYNRDIIVGYLEDYDLTLIQAENGESAVSKAKEHKPDLILMDMRMPVMSGYEATSLIKKDPELGEITIIALTASAMKRDEGVIKDLCDSYLKKPISKVHLIRELVLFLPHSIKEPPVKHDSLNSKTILAPPPGELNNLLQLAMMGNMNAITDHSQHLKLQSPQYNAFAEKLLEFTHSYQDEQIIEFIQKYTESDNG